MNFRILSGGQDDSPSASFLLNFSSGDSAAVSSTSEGEILLTIDDVDDSVLPTVRLTPLEASMLALRIAQASRRARERS